MIAFARCYVVDLIGTETKRKYAGGVEVIEWQVADFAFCFDRKER